jgi:hypothetical protein
MDRTPGPLLYEVAKYTGVKGILTMEMLDTTISKKLRGNLSAFQYAIQKVFKSDRKDWNESKEFLKSISYGTTELLGFIPYYSNGGEYGSHWRLTNLVQKATSAYCSVNNTGHNIIVKLAYSGQNLDDFQIDLPYTGELIVHHDAIYEEQKAKDALAVINQMSFAKPTGGYTCPAQNVVVFLGDSEDEHDIETHFADTKTIEDVRQVSKEHHYKIWKFE